MAKIGSMLGAVVTSPPKAQDKKRAKKSKGEKSVTQHGQQHGELLNFKAPTERQIEKDHARSAMRNATREWVEGRIGPKEHAAVHERAKHIMRGRKPRDF